MEYLEINGDNLTLENIEQVARYFREVKVADEGLSKLKVSGDILLEKAKEDKKYYAVNTGFGDLCDVKIPIEDMELLQKNLIRSHSSGVGELLSEEAVRASMLIRANTLVKGHSGVKTETVELLLAFLNKRIHPCIPCQGSVGSSGDLAPLAHMSLALIGEGEVIYKGEKREVAGVFEEEGLKPLTLGYKEGLALINGTSVMCGVGTLAILDAERIMKAVDISGTMSLDALRGTDSMARKEVHQLRPHPGQKDAAENIWNLIQGSEIRDSHRDCQNCTKVQDAYSLRCMPQVHGASRDGIAYARKVMEIEVNSVTDNPLIIVETGEIISAGHFHGQPIAIAMDYLGIAVCELASIAERRVSRMVTSRQSDLPPFLIEKSGLNSGFMIPQYTAASLVSENKVLAHPASVDSIPTCAAKEDHVSMGTIAARKARSICDNAMNVIAIELLVAAQALDFHKPLKTSPALQAVHGLIREHVEFLEEDRRLDLDINAIQGLIADSSLIDAAEKVVGDLK